MNVVYQTLLDSDAGDYAACRDGVRNTVACELACLFELILVFVVESAVVSNDEDDDTWLFRFRFDVLFIGFLEEF